MEISHRLIAGVGRILQGGKVMQTVEVSRLKNLLRTRSHRLGAFAALREFRDQLSGSKELSDKPFTGRKRVAKLYQLVFYLLSTLLLSLSLFVF